MLLQQKQLENEQALKVLAERLALLDGLDWDGRQLALCKGLIAGNVFDWGAKEVAVLMETTCFGFEQAMAKLPGKERGDIFAFYGNSNVVGHSKLSAY